jgi:sigma-B regulation protein RsbU (phosphoserine phosphatase)
MMSSRTLLKGAAIGTLDPGRVLGEVNNLLDEDNDAAMFVTLLYAVYYPATGKLTYANGGHNSPLVVHSDGSSSLLPLTDGIALGVIPGLDFIENTVVLSPGDTVIFYTDGVTEAMDDDGEEFGTERLFEIFADAPPRDSQEANDAVFTAVRDFVGDTPQSDDITCMVLYRRESDR